MLSMTQPAKLSFSIIVHVSHSSFRIVNRKRFVWKYAKRVMVGKASWSGQTAPPNRSLIIHDLRDDMPILLLLLFHYLSNCFGREEKKRPKRKYFCHIQHSWLCGSYWHFQLIHTRFGAWGILFLLLSRLFLFFFVITKYMENEAFVWRANSWSNVPAITHRINIGQRSLSAKGRGRPRGGNQWDALKRVFLYLRCAFHSYRRRLIAPLLESARDHLNIFL